MDPTNNMTNQQLINKEFLSEKKPPHTIHVVLWIVLGLSLIPAMLLLWQRISHENASKTAALVMDYNALSVQAKRYGQEPAQLLEHYQHLGINGLAIYEETIASLQSRGKLYLQNGYDLKERFADQDIKTSSVYMRSDDDNLLDNLKSRYNIPVKEIVLNKTRWLEWSVDPTYLPAGPDIELIDFAKRKGLTIVYRPYYDAAIPVKDVGKDWPDVPFIAFTGDEVIGAREPELLEQVRHSMGQRLPAIIEGNIQKGLDTLVGHTGGARLFALSPNWQNSLDPLDVASKYNLAARERAQRLLYIRPYPTIHETDLMLTRITTLLGKSGVQLTQPDIQFYRPNALLQGLSMAGPLAALVLLVLSMPLVRLGGLLAGVVLLGCFGLNLPDPFKGAALLSAVTFPALGLVLRRRHITDWFVATGLSLVGVVFVSALGATFESTLGLEPFRGVGLTLLLPLMLVAASLLPKQDIRKTVADLYNTPIRLGEIVLMAVGLGLLLMVFERRGNATGGTPSQFETELRRDLQDTIVRPRFKEVGAHPLAILALGGHLPASFASLMLLGGVMGQASILNTFSHFHTPVLISATRCFIGLGVGLLLGMILNWMVGVAMKLWRTYGMLSVTMPKESK